MWMPSHHLVGDVAGDIGEAEPSFLLGHAGVVDHLEQQIAQLVRQGGEIPAQDGVGHFVGLLDRVGRDRGEILRHVPLAAPDGVAQGSHDVEQAAQLRGGLILLGVMHYLFSHR